MTEKETLLDDLIKSDLSPVISDIENSILEPLLEEINSIQDKDILSFTKAMLLRATSFWTAPSSYDSGYYPPDELFDYGLVLHTKRVFRVVEILCALYEIEPLETDKLKSAALLHDITKTAVINPESGVVFDYLHPYTVDGMYDMVKKDDELNTGENQSNVLSISNENRDHILRAIRSHKGRNSPIPETIPKKTSLTMLLYVSNEIAKSLHYLVDGEDVILERWIVEKLDGEAE